MKIVARQALLYTGFFLLINSAANAAPGEAPLRLEEVIVTATKRASNLQDVPVAVTALSGQDLVNALVGSSEDLTQLVPSLNLNKGDNPRQTSFSIRGIGTVTFSSGIEPSVSTMLDGVVMGQSGMAFAQLVDMQRVEVLRGPQGTLFGKNSSGGVVHFITRDPSEEFEAELRGYATEDEEYRSSFTISDSITDDLAGRLTGYFNKDEGWIENVYDGDSVNDSDDWGVRGKLLWQPTDTLQFKWSSDYSEYKSHCCVLALRSMDPYPAQPPNNQADVDDILAQLAPVVPGDENRKVNLNGDLTTDTDASGHSLEVNWDIGEHTVTSISAYRDWSQNSRGDVDQLPIDALGFIQGGKSKQHQYSQELRLMSPADQFISYVVGLYYFDQTVDRKFDRSFDITGSNRTEAVADFSVDSLNYAVFGEAVTHLHEGWRLVTGFRWTHDDLKFDFERTGSTLGANPQAYFKRDTDESKWTGKVALEWDVTDTAMTYMSYAQGYKGPAFNVGFGSTQDNTDPVDPETSHAYELGLKSTWFDDRLILNVAIFHTKFDDFQASASEFTPKLDENGNPVDDDGDGQEDGVFSFVLANVGKVETQGVEVDFTALPLENLTVSGGMAYVDAQINEFEGAGCSFGQSFRGVGYKGQTTCGDNPATQNLGGGDLPSTPKWKFTLAASYLIPLQSMPFDLSVNGNYRYQDEVQFRIEQDVNTTEDAYGILDLSLVALDHEEHYTVTLFTKNVFDEWHVSTIASLPGNFTPNGYAQQVPRYAERTFGVEVRYLW
ncbi:Pesticin receptor [Halioglobus japonicus]|nr:Pesticin receptor [Halioglobus japonicus]